MQNLNLAYSDFEMMVIAAERNIAAIEKATVKPRKPIIQVTSLNMGTILVFRSPFSRNWLFNLSISNGVNMRPVLYSVLSALILFLVVGCEPPGNMVASKSAATTKAKYTYTHASDTLYRDDMATWDNGDSTETGYRAALVWTTATIYAYQGDIKWTVATLNFSKPVKTSTKPAYWDGQAVQISWDKMPKLWDKVVIRFSDKTEVQ